MRTELHRLRDAGAAFPAAWDIALSYALGQLPSGERTEWRRAFDSMRPMWAEAYAGMEARPLPFLPDDEHVAA